MIRTILRTSALCVLAALLTTGAFAQEGAYITEVQESLDNLEEKFLGLAEAVPADKFTYRPGEGIRSMSEVLLHIAGANYFFAGLFGTPPPEGVNPRGLEKSTTDPKETAAKLKASFAHIRGAVGKLGAGDADKPMKMFGRDKTTRAGLTSLVGHHSEHLGQAIAYTRVVGAVPPWSE